MIGIIVWLLLIIIIAICACPGFLVALATIFGICAFGILILWLFAKLTNKRTEEAHTDREKAIDEWEQIHRRKHPSRMSETERAQYYISLRNNR